MENFWDGFEKRAGTPFNKLDPDNIEHKLSLEEHAYAGKPLPKNYVNKIVGRVKDPVRQKELRRIAKDSPGWFFDYEHISDQE